MSGIHRIHTSQWNEWNEWNPLIPHNFDKIIPEVSAHIRHTNLMVKNYDFNFFSPYLERVGFLEKNTLKSETLSVL